MKNILSAIFVVFIFSALVGTFTLSSPDVIVDENRTRAEFPEFDIKRSFRKYFSAIDQFAVDNFPFRKYLMGGFSEFVGATGARGAVSEKIFHGKDDWLFVGNDVFRTADKLEGRLDSLTEKLYMAYAVHSLAKWFDEQEVEVIFLLGPNKAVVYPEYLPSILKPSARRYSDRSMDWLRSNGVSVVDPTAALLDRKKTNIVYWKRDTHWNLIGGSVAFEQAMNFMGIHDCPSWGFELDEDFHRRDLELLGSLPRSSAKLNDHFKILWNDDIHPVQKEIDYPEFEETIRAHEFINDNPAQKSTIWVVGDSFSGHVTPFLSHCFAKTVFYRFDPPTLDYLKNEYLNAKSKPARVIIELVERNF